MADTTSAVNGLYGNQYGQPVELAASTPSAPAHASTGSQSSTAASAAAQKADPQEIGWYFVEQYYTTLSKSPERIHLFYKKKSQLVTGVEAEKVIPAVGEKAISEKIKSLDIRDCKVRVLNVDSQASFANIVVQVIGEMSNKNQPHHKFVQTFVLAEQPNGYFVLNDIFRYLNEEEDEIVEDEAGQSEVPASQPATPADATVAMPTEELATTETVAEEADVKQEEEEEEEQQEEEGDKAEVEADPEAEAEAEDSASVNGVDAEEAVDEQVAAPESTDADEEVEEPSPEPTEPTEPEPDVATPPKPSEPEPEAQPMKKTWASMVGGKAPAVPALPTQTSAPPQPRAQKPTSQTVGPKTTPSEPAAASPSPTPSNGWQTADHGKKGRSGSQAKPDGNVLAYIKNVNEKVDARTLREVLEKYGELKYYDVSRPRNCAFVEFANPEGYAAAVAANPHTVGSETISVEERRPRPNAYGGTNAPFGRGNNQNTRGRGNMQQRSGSHGGTYPKDAPAPRGGLQQRGAKSGNVTPRGRGQTQAA